jgi:signal transduction histidine kinase
MRELGRSALSRATATWLAVGIGVSLVLVLGLGYRVLGEWRATAASFARHRAEENARLLSTALLRDMRGAQELVLASSRLYAFVLQAPYDVRNEAAGAFARYPYPESFFSWRRGAPPAAMVFFNRGNRRPAWMDAAEDAARAPVVIESQPHVAAQLLSRIMTDVERRRPIAAFETTIDGTPYQVVAQLVYNDMVGDDLAAIVGFTVNLPWARQHYFPEITGQVARIAGERGAASLAVLDERGGRVAGAVSPEPGETVRRPFGLLFLDPLLVASDPPPDLPVQQWAIEVAVESDAALATAIGIANRVLAVAAFATATLTLGLVLSVRAARASAELSEMRSDFVSTVTHELKTPIASIRAIGDTIVSGRASGGVLLECAHLVVQESKRLTRLVDNLLAYSRITDVTEAYLFEPMEVSALMEAVLEGFAWQLRDRRFAVHVDTPADLPLILGDRTALRLAFDNVIDNAIRYSADARLIRVIATAANRCVAVEISDCGVGIPADELSLITRRFFRGRGARAGGSGLGLTIAQRILSDHDGVLTVTSNVGHGTTVRVTLPQAEGDHAQENPRRRG